MKGDERHEERHRVRGKQERKERDKKNRPHFHWLCAIYLWHQILEAGNDVGTLEFLVVTKTASYHDDRN